MADIANKYPESVPGKFYVDDQCRETAPANFRRNDDGGYSFVFNQPTTPEEEALCKEAMEGCPGRFPGTGRSQCTGYRRITFRTRFPRIYLQCRP